MWKLMREDLGHWFSWWFSWIYGISFTDFLTASLRLMNLGGLSMYRGTVPNERGSDMDGMF
jgi:hypothetical protein